MKHKTFKKEMYIIGDMPPFVKIAYALWGENVNFDSDGDSTTPDATDWRELTLIRRPECDERLDIDPIQEDSEKVLLQASSEHVLLTAIEYLIKYGSIGETLT